MHVLSLLPENFEMERIVIRQKGVGPLGYVKTVAPCALSELRKSMLAQCSELLPADGFRFLSGGIPVALGQEAEEDYCEGDVFIMAQPAGAATSAPTAPCTAPAVAPSLPAKPAAQPLVAQWVDAFGFMSADEQTEAIGTLRLRYPAAGSMVSGGGGGSSNRSSPRAAAASRLPAQPAAAASPMRHYPHHQHHYQPHLGTAECASPRSAAPGSSRGATPPRRGVSTPPQVPAPPPTRHTQPQHARAPPWSPAGAGSGRGDLPPVPLDERISRIYYGRGPGGRPLASPSPRGRTPSPSSRGERLSHSLHSSGTLSSTFRNLATATSCGSLSLAEAAPVARGGSTSASSTNAFASTLRVHGARAPDAGQTPAQAPSAVTIPSGRGSPERSISPLASSRHRSPTRSPTRSVEEELSLLSRLEARSPSSLARPHSALSGAHEPPHTATAARVLAHSALASFRKSLSQA